MQRPICHSISYTQPHVSLFLDKLLDVIIFLYHFTWFLTWPFLGPFQPEWYALMHNHLFMKDTKYKKFWGDIRYSFVAPYVSSNSFAKSCQVCVHFEYLCLVHHLTSWRESTGNALDVCWRHLSLENTTWTNNVYLGYLVSAHVNLRTFSNSY